MEAWTPTETVHPQPKKLEPWETQQTQPRRHKTDMVTRPLLPTFVFAKAGHLNDLIALSHSPSLQYQVWDSEQRRMVVKGHPYFRVFNAEDCLVRDVELAHLRRIEGKRRKPRGTVPTFEPGDKVRLTEGAYGGLRGVVVRSEGKLTVVRFPQSNLQPKIHSWLLIPDLDDSEDVKVKEGRPEHKRSAA